MTGKLKSPGNHINRWLEMINVTGYKFFLFFNNIIYVKIKIIFLKGVYSGLGEAMLTLDLDLERTTGLL